MRITGTEPHPNADRLELAKFEMDSGPTGYTVVVQKDTYKRGDRAVYVSVDAIVPLNRPEFEFLGQREDGKGKERFRVRAAKIRGMFSEGLLVPAPAGYDVGQSVAEAWGVGYHNPEIAATAGHYPVATGKKQVSGRAPAPVYTVESLKKLPFLFKPSDNVIITEKVHGTNFRFGWVRRRGWRGFLPGRWGWEFVYGSHRTWKSPDASHDNDLWAYAVRKFGLREKAWDMRGIIFYGELYGKTPGGGGIQDLTYGRSDTNLVVFDGYDVKERLYITHDELALLAAFMGVEMPTVLYRGSYDAEVMRELAEGPSTVAYTFTGQTAHTREGVVVEDLLRNRKGKYVGEGYKTRKIEEKGAQFWRQ